MAGDMITMKMDAAQVLYYLEGCAHGSHLRQGCWHEMIRLYPRMGQGMRDFLFTYAKRDIAPLYEPTGCYSRCGREDFGQFLACFDKDNRYVVTAEHDGERETAEAYLCNGKYYTGVNSYFAQEFITKIEKPADSRVQENDKAL